MEKAGPQANACNSANATNSNSSYDEMDTGTDELEGDEDKFHPVYFANQISVEQYEKQRSEYSAQAIQQLINSPQYQKKLYSCGTCWSSWLEGHSRSDCMECGGFALSRPCPICKGKCGGNWKRNVDMSHAKFEAHWDGSCKLPDDQREMFLLQLMSDDLSEHEVIDNFQDLSTS